jgi:hypothetical protein
VHGGVAGTAQENLHDDLERHPPELRQKPHRGLAAEWGGGSERQTHGRVSGRPTGVGWEARP